MHVLLLAGLIGVGVAAPADDKPILLKSRERAAGHRFKTAAEVTQEIQITVAGPNVEGQDKTIKFGSTAEYTDELVEVADGGKRWPFKLKRTFHAAEGTNPDGAANLRLAGRTVTVTGAEDGGLKLEATGIEDLTPEADGLVRSDFGHPKSSFEAAVMLPDKPLKAGDTWTPDMAKAFAVCPANLTRDEGAATATGKLVEQTVKDGRVYAKYEWEVTIPVTKQTQDDGGESPLRDGSKLVVRFTYDGCADGSRHDGTSEVVVTSTLKPDLPGVELTISSTRTHKRTVTDLAE